MNELLTQFGPAIAALAAAFGGTEAPTQVKKRLDLGPNSSLIVSGVAAVGTGFLAAQATGMDWKAALGSSVVGWFSAQAGYKAKKRKGKRRRR